ncbi:hypothetical protein [Mycobacterium spongiae]|nr:hypothetical protein [Mycobacterium spongiae]
MGLPPSFPGVVLALPWDLLPRIGGGGVESAGDSTDLDRGLLQR